MSMTDAAASVLREVETRFGDHARALEAGSTAAESVHQTRVALRRLRVALRVFGDVLGEGRTSSLAKSARWLFVRLGHVRELQLLCAQLPSYGLPAPTLRTDRAVVGAALESACGALTAALASTRYATFRQELHQAHLAPGSLREVRAGAGARVKAQLRRWHRKARQHARACPVTPADQHALRKELKRLRYAAELLQCQPSAPAKKLAPYLRRLAKLQDVLGALVDAHQACLLARRLQTSGLLRESLAAQRAELRTMLQPELTRRLHWFVHKRPVWAHA
jgi:CHAD domain-containing protein